MAPSPPRPTTTVAALLLAVLTILLLTNPSAAQQSSPPSALAAPELTAQTADVTIELTWTEVSGAARYELWTWWAEETGWQQLGGDDLTAAAYTHTGLAPGTTYYYQIRAVAAGGVTGEWSQRISVSLPANLPAPALTARALTGAVDLSWEPVPGAARYELWTWWDDDSGWQQLGGDNLIDTSHSHTGTAPGLTYYYQMRAVDALGVAGPWSRQVSAAVAQEQPLDATPAATATTGITTTSTPTANETPNELPTPTPSPTPTATPSPMATAIPTPTATSAPTAFSAPVLTAVATESAVQLSWNAVPDAVRYELWYWTSAAGWHQLDNGALTAAGFTHSDLSAGATYYYSARALNAAGDTTPWSEFASAAPVPDGTPTPTPSPTLSPTPPPSPTPTPLLTPTPTSIQPAGAHVQSPPASLNVHSYYRKYLDAGGIPILSSNDVTDEELYQARDTILAMLSDRPDILATMAEFAFRVLIYPDRFEKGGRLADLPEFSGLDVALRAEGLAGETPYGWVSGSPEVARHCNHTLIHEFAHQIEDALRLQPGGQHFMARLNSTYQAAMLTGLWQDRYASTSALEYWAEIVRNWLTPSQFAGWLGPGYQKLEDYDPVGAALVAEVLGNPQPLTFCEIRRFDVRGTLNLPGGQTPNPIPMSFCSACAPP